MRPSELFARARREFVEYALNVVYLSVVFAAFTVYRRLMLAAHDIVYADYFIAVIQAMVLGKVIMIGSVTHLGRGFESRPLIYPTIYKTVVFAALVAAFKFIEFGLRGWWRGDGFRGGIVEEASGRGYEILANSIVIFVALLPFFAVKELSRVLGQKKLAALFFQRREAP